MARPLRIEYPGAWYHVLNRAARRRRVFDDGNSRSLFLALLGELSRRFGTECHAYCLMGNHYHLLLRTPRGNLSASMQHFDGLLAQRHNCLTGSDGPLFRGRYKAILVDAERYLLGLSCYIHRNPLNAGLVKRPEDYEWSSYRAYLGITRKPEWLETGVILDSMGNGDRASEYRTLVEGDGSAEVDDRYASDRRAPILGDEAFRERVLGGREEDREQPQSRHRYSPPSTADITEAVATVFAVHPSVLCSSIRGRGRRNIPRAVAMYLNQRVAGRKLDQIASEFGVGHYATASVTIRRLRATLESDEALAQQVRQIEERLRRAAWSSPRYG
jgi:REP element-mobilizing transposase RayT